MEKKICFLMRGNGEREMDIVQIFRSRKELGHVYYMLREVNFLPILGWKLFDRMWNYFLHDSSFCFHSIFLLEKYYTYSQSLSSTLLPHSNF